MLVSFESYSGPSGILYMPVQRDSNIADLPGFDRYLLMELLLGQQIVFSIEAADFVMQFIIN